MFSRSFSPTHRLGSLAVAVGQATRAGDCQVQIFEDYDDPFNLFCHLCFVFEDCAFVLNHDGSLLSSRTRIRSVMERLLVEVGHVMAIAATAPQKISSHPFEITKNVVPVLTQPVSFQYRSELYRFRDTYYDRRLSASGEQSSLGGWQYHRDQHTAAFALFSTLATKAQAHYDPGAPEFIRLVAGVHGLHTIYKEHTGFAESGVFNPKARGEAPNAVIEITRSLSPERLEAQARTFREALWAGKA